MNKIVRIIEQADAPLTRLEISRRLAETESSKYIDNNVSALLGSMVKEGKLIKLRRGWYALHKFAEEWRGIIAETEDMIIATLQQANEPLDYQAIHRRAFSNPEGYMITEETLKSKLNAMARDGAIVRLQSGIYAVPQTAEKWREVFSAPPTNEAKIAQVLKHAGRPLHYLTVCQELSADGGKALAFGNVNSKLNSMVREGAIVRVERGIFALPEFAGGAYEVLAKPQTVSDNRPERRQDTAMSQENVRAKRRRWGRTIARRRKA